MRLESTINAVTAGLNPSDAVIAVTQGALDHLNREEIQAVVAHEFAHILNEDYRLNMMMSGWLYGLLCFFIIGRGFTIIVSRAACRSSKKGGRVYLVLLCSC